MRAGGAGIPGFYTPAGVGTLVAEGKETRVFDGREYVLERGIVGDFALVAAWKGDRLGQPRLPEDRPQLQPDGGDGGEGHHRRGRGARRGRRARPGEVHTPGVFVNRVVVAPAREADRAAHGAEGLRRGRDGEARPRDGIVRRAAQELRDGMYVNLGIGMPTLVANHIPPGMEVVLQSENGILGLGPYPTEAEVDADLINAGKETVTVMPGASFFSSADSFAMIRGGHIDLSILGAMQVDARGVDRELDDPRARWSRGWAGHGPRRRRPAGHRHDGARAPRTATQKILDRCTLPLTGRRCVAPDHHRPGRVRREARTARACVLVERAPGVSVEEIVAATEPPLEVRGDVPEMKL